MSVTFVAEPIEVRLTGTRRQVLDGVDTPHGKGQFDRPTEKHCESAAVFAEKGSFYRQYRRSTKGIMQSSIAARLAMRPFVTIF